MKYGYIRSDSSADKLMSEIKRLEDAGVAVENIFVAIPINELIEKVKRDDKIVVVNYSDVFAGLNHFLQYSITLLEKGVEMESLSEEINVVTHKNYEIVKVIWELGRSIHSINTKREIYKAKDKGIILGRPRIDAKVEQVIKLLESKNVSITQACKEIGCNQRTYYRYLNKKITPQ